MVTFRLENESISLELPVIAKKELDFTGSAFFTYPSRRLPSPAEVRALSNETANVSKPGLVELEDLNLIVRFGPRVSTLEALNPWVVRRLLKDKVPVPEVFGWRIDDQGHFFIYMDLIKGPTLLEAVSDQLAGIVQCLRQLEQDPSDRFIVSINKQYLQDYVFTSQPKMGPFLSVKDFNDQFALLHQLPLLARYADPYRGYLPDDIGINLTHADLHRANIIVSPSMGYSSSPGAIRLVIEYCKALYTAPYEDEWRRDGYIDRVLQPWEDVYLVWSE
ncbi:phosphotransferase enzyme family protein [Aspergillus insuetus]